MDPLSCLPLFVKDWLFTIFIGALVTSYWRGTWVLIDIWTCYQPHTASLVGGDSFCFMVPALTEGPGSEYWDLRLKSARITYLIGIVLLCAGISLLWSGAWTPEKKLLPNGRVLFGKRISKLLAFVRLVIVYILGASAVCLWRGIWYWADAWILPNDPLKSYWVTSLAGSTAAFLVGAGNSLLAPPAIFLIDGPGKSPPPIGVTVLSSYYSVTLPHSEEPPKLSFVVKVLDVIGSFFFLPFAVVWFWRGTWLLFDNYLWGFSLERQDVLDSMLWGVLFTIGCYSLASEPTFAVIEKKIPNKTVLGMLGRLRTYLLALGTNAIWRTVWYMWDEFAGCSELSAACSHAIPVVLLTIMGCVSSINAPASTLGVDAIPHKDCADEPLFSPLPIPYDLLYVFGIARQHEQKGAVAESVLFEGNEEIESPQMFKEESESFDDQPKGKEKTPLEIDETAEETARESQYGVSYGQMSFGASLLSQSSMPFNWSRNQTYMELQRPGLRERVKTGESKQRPSDMNPRLRSSLYRSR